MSTKSQRASARNPQNAEDTIPDDEFIELTPEMQDKARTIFNMLIDCGPSTAIMMVIQCYLNIIINYSEVDVETQLEAFCNIVRDNVAAFTQNQKAN